MKASYSVSQFVEAENGCSASYNGKFCCPNVIWVGCYCKVKVIEKNAVEAAALVANSLLVEGYPEAQYLYGCVWIMVMEWQKIKLKAAHWYPKSANKGNTYAQNKLGFKYFCRRRC
jgi:TPR repeat protein